MPDVPHLQRAAAIVTDKPGVLHVLNTLPFEARRLFWISTLDRPAERGGHAHRSCRQMLVPVQGHLTARCSWWSHGEPRDMDLTLEPGSALTLPPFVWLEMELGSGSVCVVLASEPYEAAEYITDREELRRLACPS